MGRLNHRDRTVDLNTIKKMENQKMLEYLSCPKCFSPLDFAGNNFCCSKCGIHYKIIDDVATFTKFDDFQYTQDVDSLSLEDLETINLIISNEEIDSAKAKIKERYNQFYNYLFEPGRADWKFYIDLNEKSKILDLGCGWGNLSCELAREYGNVISVDISSQKLKFLGLRAEKEGINNIDLIRTDLNERLPFIDNYFDLVILNGVLEWAGEYEKKKSPQSCQIDLLKEIHRVLKKDGILYIGIENRYGYQYFLGKPDDHSSVKYTTLMPRKFANWYMKIKKGKEYRTYTYSYNGIKNILRMANFKKIEMIYSFPNYKYFTYLIPLGNSKACAYFYRCIYAKQNKLEDVLKRIFISIYRKKRYEFFRGIRDIFIRIPLIQPFLKYFVPSFSIIARKEI